MDPLNALSLAGNVIQFVDFGNKLLGKAGELYRSPSGSLAVHDIVELITTDLRALIATLRQSIPSANSPENLHQAHNDSWSSFRKICDEAAKVADELVGRLSQLKIKDSKHRKLRSIQHAVESLWSEKEIAALLQRLSSLKEALESRILFSIRLGSLLSIVWAQIDIRRETLDAQSIRASARFDSLDIKTQQIVSAMLETRANITNEISREIQDGMNALTITLTQLLSRL